MGVSSRNHGLGSNKVQSHVSNLACSVNDSGLIDKYCRNPESSRPRAWCYVDDGDSSFEFCDVPDCSDCGSPAVNWTDYSGTESVTRNGKSCVPWETKRDLLVSNSSTLSIPDEWGLESNYCANPAPHQDYLWCYTDEDSEEWDYCREVPECEEEDSPFSEMCGTVALRQVNYRGAVNATASGKSCQAWSSQSDVLGLGLEDRNYCRNPTTNETKYLAWCYTTDNASVWEYCNVPACEDEE